jgi:hypothetical protein
MFQAFFLSLNGVRSNRSRGEWSSAARPSRDGLLNSSPAAAFLGAFLGCLATSYLSALGIAPAIASALATTLLCGQVLAIQTTRSLPDALFTAIYGGAFGGMTSVLWFNNNASDPSFLQLSLLLTSLAVICGLAFCTVAAFDGRTDRPLACGYGGRSGAIAAAACLAFVELASLAGADDRIFRSARADILDAAPTPAVLTFVACLMGTFAVLLPLRGQGLKSARTADRVFLSATIALIGLIGLRLSGLGDAAASDAFYAGCFLGMSTPQRMKGRIEAVLAAVVLTALLVQVKRLLPGIGGSLGLAAFLTVAAFVALSQVTAFVAQAFLDRKGVFNMRPKSFPGNQLTVDVRRLESQPASPMRRRQRIAFNAILASLAFGCFVVPVLLAPDGLVVGMANSTQVGGNTAPIPEPSVLSQTVVTPGTIVTPGDDASPLTRPSVEANVDKADLMMAENSSVADRGVDGQVDLKNRGDAATSATSENAAKPAASEAVAAPTLEAAPIPQAGVRDVPTVAGESSDKIFQEFLRWRAAHSTETAAPGQKPKKKRNNTVQVVVPLATVTSAAPARPRENRPHRIVPPSGTGPVEASTHPSNAPVSSVR